MEVTVEVDVENPQGREERRVLDKCSQLVKDDNKNFKELRQGRVTKDR